MHLLLDHDGYLPPYVHISEGKLHEIKGLRQLSFPPGTIVVIDRGLVDDHLFGTWTEKGVFFVTRLKKKASYRVLERREVPQRRYVVKDEVVEWEGFYSKEKCPYGLRIVEVWDEQNQETVPFLTH